MALRYHEIRPIFQNQTLIFVPPLNLSVVIVIVIIISYALSVHGRGPAINGFGEEFNEEDEGETSSHVTIRNNNIRNIKCWTKEIPGTRTSQSH